MIIDRIEPIALRIPAPKRTVGVPAPLVNADMCLTLCRVTTRDGLVGWGECLSLRPPMQNALFATIRDAIAPHYLGQPVDRKEALNLAARKRFASFGRAGTVMNALAAVDIALWDIAGKASGQSVSAMLGGARRNRVPVMASLDKYDHAARARQRVEQALASGVASVKVHEASLEVIEEARRAIPSSTPYVADSNNAHTLADIRRDAERWAALGLLWFEDPFWPPEDLLDCPALPGIVIGMGADFGSAEQMAVFSKTPAIGVLQPDVCMLGGLSEAKRTLAMLAAAKKTAAPHTPFVGPAALASLHMLAVTEEEGYFATVEADDSMNLYGIGLTRWQKSLEVPTGPGLGFDPDPGFLRRHLYATGT
ncbi:MAG: mandelate racemase/muconate lactonizing enzyme family protein [Reyranella sp.]|uniref:mandelate racemase/muconate lactonizing enzyme family protein n=1 Tax=Reyranella sp. TaxID=1929291 RepID=UPI00273224C0|nr:mandelate racemase/muconate lactonizing enzyme family protein [Reyranella sp.]MDP1963773.1 mandelate racemase/muconate lactonizing enzyme family protein [Reyranella sp.]MDP2375067.1 mandelate racemase/muconate lactonizing enzyme family protein [Reyranella sp.]